MDSGYEPLGIGDGERDGIVYVPASAGPGAPLMLLFHGFGGTGSREIVAVRQPAERHGVMVVVPERYDIDPRRFAVSGISDGASYALCVGPRNDCTTIAFSAGFAFPGEG